VNRALDRRAVGRLAEEIAVRHLVRSHAAEILARNVVIPEGEADVLAVVDGERTLVEVRGRRGEGSVLDAFDDAKARRVRRLSARLDPPCTRIDVVAVAIGSRTVDIHHVPRVC
jgi:Holliday junction resolvase-like predicted endonuclease